jgi:sugar/nucleoside kinase (ribokinase family)
MTAAYDVLVYGPLFCDLIFTGLDDLPALGKEHFADDLTIAIGGSAIVAAGLHKLGARVGLIAELGSDPLSLVARHLLDDLGIDRTLIREHAHPLPQVTIAMSFPHDRAFVTRFKRPDAPPDLAAILRNHPAKHLHVCSFLAVLETPDAARIAHEAGMTISMDPGWDDDALHNPRLHAMIRELDIFLPSRSELCYIAEQQDHNVAARQTLATMSNGLIVMKDGARGAEAFTPDSRDGLRVPAIAVTPVDTTGAGDAFDAGYLYAYVNGLPLDECMQYGTICGGLATTAPGGATASPSIAEVEKWLSKSRS